MEDVTPAPSQQPQPRHIQAPSAWLSFDQLELTPVDPRYINQVMTENLLVFVPTLIAVPIIGILANLPMLILLLLVTGVLILAGIVSFGRYRFAQSLAYGVFEHELLMQQGLIWHKKIALPYSRLQHVTLSQGPLERYFQHHTLKCFSAGSGNAEISLPGIPSDIAEPLRHHLLNKAAALRETAKQSQTPTQELTDE
ncbi:PH domain-containing protein [Shewanella sp. Isolate11]|uniref:PH domain-containing protein n=1 Tax=Shewanella sp. Isolate11 TaxID=2908530 RepID=UPI001EFC716E|nr:PH domain-containing protein [Shewanella sp. Isolate11]MCG9695757.1 PH domain-containing protein [Shewanella sp. Isolate11]